MARDLSDTARTILAAAAARPNLHLLPLPLTLKAPPVIIRKTVSTLMRTGLVAEVPAEPGEPLWESPGCWRGDSGRYGGGAKRDRYRERVQCAGMACAGDPCLDQQVGQGRAWWHEES